jgi:hypothetical protein
MHFDKFIRPAVGADLSRPPPIYRPVMPDDAHGRIAYATSIIEPPIYRARHHDRFRVFVNEFSTCSLALKWLLIYVQGMRLVLKHSQTLAFHKISCYTRLRQ